MVEYTVDLDGRRGMAEQNAIGKRRKLAVVRDILIELGARTAGQLAGKLIGV